MATLYEFCCRFSRARSVFLKQSTFICASELIYDFVFLFLFGRAQWTGAIILCSLSLSYPLIFCWLRLMIAFDRNEMVNLNLFISSNRLSWRTTQPFIYLMRKHFIEVKVLFSWFSLSLSFGLSLFSALSLSLSYSLQLSGQIRLQNKQKLRSQ